jgi:hypothetical protein
MKVTRIEIREWRHNNLWFVTFSPKTSASTFTGLLSVCALALFYMKGPHSPPPPPNDKMRMSELILDTAGIYLSNKLILLLSKY